MPAIGFILRHLVVVVQITSDKSIVKKLHSARLGKGTSRETRAENRWDKFVLMPFADDVRSVLDCTTNARCLDVMDLSSSLQFGYRQAVAVSFFLKPYRLLEIFRLDVTYRPLAGGAFL